MTNNKILLLALFPVIIFILVAFLSYADNMYGPAPTPVVYTTYTITMNLTDSRPTISFLASIESTYPLLYHEDELITNTTPIWIGTANKEFSLYIINATPTTINQQVVLNSIAMSNSTGGITWNVKVPLYLIYPQPVYANWYIIITENVDNENYVVFMFETYNESLSSILTELSTIGGYLTALNGEPYYLWHHYYGYNPTTGTVDTYYEVGLPGISIYYTWVGQGENATSWPSSGFAEALRIFKYGFYEYLNSTLINEELLEPNITIGNITNYGYAIYQRPRLIPFGPIVYVSPIVFLPNGTIVNPICIPNTYYILTVNFITQGGTPITVYETKNYPLNLYLLNGSLLFGGYLQAYDFYNETTIPITPIQYLTPTYQSEIMQYSQCSITLFTSASTDNETMSGNLIETSISGVTIDSVISNSNATKSTYIPIGYEILKETYIKVHYLWWLR
ncbi:MAG: hypothetical protein ACP5NQ_01100 [Vulcanisaeta sp.]